MPAKKPPAKRKRPSGRAVRRKKNATASPFWIVIILLGIFAALFHFTDVVRPASALAENELRVSFLDVGQGDSALIYTRDNAVLIDGGEYAERQGVLDALRAAGVTTLDYVVATHPHSDHIGGLPAVLQAFDVRRVLMPDAAHNTATFENLLDAVEARNIPVTVPQAGETFSAGLIQLTALTPAGGPYDNINDASLTLRLAYGQTAFLFTGDAEQTAEADILASGADVRAQVLKAGHHGSRTASSDAFLDAVNPRVVVISCGRGNSYGHPHPEVLAALTQRGVPFLYRTDETGTVTLSTDGQVIRYLP